jgi:AcrR family transcriptional regulator
LNQIIDVLMSLRYHVTIQSHRGVRMPKPTFFNLPEAKRLLIIDTSLEEFASNTYDKASLSQIVLKAGIAKGSMYQYFNDKEELYA